MSHSDLPSLSKEGPGMDLGTAKIFIDRVREVPVMYAMLSSVSGGVRAR